MILPIPGVMPNVGNKMMEKILLPPVLNKATISV